MPTAYDEVNMSEERELLERVWASEKWDMPEDLQIEIKELLAQPEPEPEPMFKKPSEIALKIANEIADQFQVGFCDYRMVEYFAEAADKHLPKREPLSDEELSILATDDLYDCTYTTTVFAYKEYARKIEKAHGIGDGG